uniref:RING-type domain-containing protein n=1 Tax=viral metagenome TaxID=1070528 RepID=A0A6C0DFB8_9ZZZZ
MAETEVVEFEINRSPSMVDLFMDDEISRLNVTERPCGFCGDYGHLTGNCQHGHIDLLQRCAMFIYLVNIRYLKSIHYNMDYHKINPEDPENHDVMIHTRWLMNLTIPEKKILCRVNGIDLTEIENMMFPSQDLFRLLHEFYFDYAMLQLVNNHLSNPRMIQDIYYTHLEQMTSASFRERYGNVVLNNVIENSGRFLLNFERIRIMLSNQISYYVDEHVDSDRYFENIVFNPQLYPFSLNNFMNEPQTVRTPAKIIVEQLTEENEKQECPICFVELNQDTNCVKTNCKHHCCCDCMIQIVNNNKKNKNLVCFMCRTVVDEISVSNNEIKDTIHKETNGAFN